MMVYYGLLHSEVILDPIPYEHQGMTVLSRSFECSKAQVLCGSLLAYEEVRAGSGKSKLHIQSGPSLVPMP